MRTIWITFLLCFLSTVSLHAKTFENKKIEVYISTPSNLAAENYVLEKEIVRFINESQATLDIAVQEICVGKTTTENPIFTVDFIIT